MFKKSESPDILPKIERSVSETVEGRVDRIQELQKRLGTLRNNFQNGMDGLNLVFEQRMGIQGRIDEILKKITSNLDNPNVYEEFENNSELPHLKSELLQLDKQLAAFPEMSQLRMRADHLNWDLEDLNKQITQENVDLESQKNALASIQEEVEHLELGLNGELDESRRKLDEDVEELVRVRTDQLREKEKAENILSIIESLDESQKEIFLKNLKPEDRGLIEGYKSGALDEKNKSDLARVEKRQQGVEEEEEVNGLNKEEVLTQLKTKTSDLRRELIERIYGPDSSTPDEMEIEPILVSPNEQGWSKLVYGAYKSDVGKYTLNPDLLNIDFNSKKISIIKPDRYTGYTIADAIKRIVEDYGDKYYLPDMNYLNWVKSKENISKPQYQKLRKHGRKFFLGSIMCFRNGSWQVLCSEKNSIGIVTYGTADVSFAWRPEDEIVLIKK